MPTPRVIAMAVLIALARAGLAQPDQDTDTDGLSDFHEVHKHLTDPTNPDSDADGIPDGDWLERREFTYTVCAVMHIIKPINAGTLTDDYQDGRVLDDQDDYAEIEVVLYPYNTVAAGLTGSTGWRSAGVDGSLAPYLAPGPTTNWDDAMRAELEQQLGEEGIDLDALSDSEAAARVASWLMHRVNSEDSFTTFAVDFEEGRAVVTPDMVAHWEGELSARGRTIEEQMDHELFGRGMFRTRTIGSCTSAAIYVATGMKAAGFPARTVVCVPVTDGSDPAELALAERLTNHRVRRTVVRSAREHGDSWTSHTFNEVFVGGRWRRLNYDRLGQNILDDDFLGLMVHVNTFRDHAEAGLSAWGRRNGGDHNDVCGGSNPYSCISLSDRFGPHCTLDNPAPEGGLAHLTINRAYWYDLQAEPPRVQMSLDLHDGAGHLVVVVDEGADFRDYGDFYAEAGKAFLLHHPDHPHLRALATRGFWIDGSTDLRDFYLQIPPEDYARLVPGVEYRLLPQDAQNGREWRVHDDVRIVRPER